MQLTCNSNLINKIKNSDIFETLRHAKNYLSADVATKSLGFISIPIFTRLFTQEDYGIVAIFASYVGIMTVILSLNSYTAVGRYYYEKTDDFGEFVGTTFIFTGLILCISVIIYILFYQQINNLIKLPGLLSTYLIFTCLFAIIQSIYTQILVPQKKSKELAIINVLNGYIGFAIAVLFVYLLKENRYLGRIWATLLIGFIFSIYYIKKINKYLKFNFKIEHIKYIANYSIPSIPHSLSGVILDQFDRIMINNIINTASAGLYSLGYNIGMLLLMVNGSILTAFVPDFIKFLDNKEYNRLDVLMGKVFSIGTIAALGLVLFAREIVMVLVDVKFHEALKVVPIVVIGYVFHEMYFMYGMYPGYKKKTIYTSIVTLSAGSLDVVLNAMFIPKYGYIAAAYTTLVSYFAMFVMAWIMSKYILKQRVSPLWLFWKPTLIMFGFIAFASFLNTLELNTILFFSLKLVLLGLFSIMIFYKEIRTILLSCFNINLSF
jgi:O-antigen/teichoic acid export membrane protein